MRMVLRMNRQIFVLAAEIPCEWKFETKFASDCECDGVVHSVPNDILSQMPSPDNGSDHLSNLQPKIVTSKIIVVIFSQVGLFTLEWLSLRKFERTQSGHFESAQSNHPGFEMYFSVTVR